MNIEKIILTNLRIPGKGNMQYYANFEIGNVQKEDILRNEPMKNRQVHINCPPNMDLFTHMKICLIGYLYEDKPEYFELMNRVIKSNEKEIKFGKFFMSEIGNFTTIVDNVEKVIYLEKII